MKKKSKLLNVVSIILIVFSVIGILSGIFAIIMKDLMAASYEMLGMEPLPT